jgi:hypothetical protein
MSAQTVAAWICDMCEVAGRTPSTEEPRCWNCEGPVTITARPVVSYVRQDDAPQHPAA